MTVNARRTGAEVVYSTVSRPRHGAQHFDSFRIAPGGLPDRDGDRAGEAVGVGLGRPGHHAEHADELLGNGRGACLSTVRSRSGRAMRKVTEPAPAPEPAPLIGAAAKARS